MAIVATKHLERIKQLLTYQTLIGREAKRCGGKGWLVYDSMFRQQVAGTRRRIAQNSTGSFYAVSFFAHAGGGRTCSLCMESDHGDEECALVCYKASSAGGKNTKPVARQEGTDSSNRFTKGKTRLICFAWNQGECTFLYCRYRHVCEKCSGEHRITQCRVVTAERDGPRRLGRDARSARCERTGPPAQIRNSHLTSS